MSGHNNDYNLEMQPSPSTETPYTDDAQPKGPDVSTTLRPVVTIATEVSEGFPDQQYTVYKRRFFGLGVLVLLNIVASWDWLTFSAVSSTSAQYFKVSETSINWLSTGYLFAFVFASPFTMWTLNKGGPKASIITAASLTLVGNWIRYAGSRTADHGFGIVIFGQVIIGMAQPFCLAAPTRYSDTWFSDAGKVSATAAASLANPLGGALGQLIGPIWVSAAADIPNMVLYTAIISSVACVPAFFVPARPPTPPSATSVAAKLHFRESFSALASNTSFYLILVPFAIYVGLFNSFSSLINQIVEPYGLSETEAGIAGGILIVVGLVTSAIVSPIIDRTKAYLVAIRVCVPLIAIGYLIMVFVPQTGSPVAVYIVCGLIGAASFALLPCALEYMVELTHPVSPEISSVVCWASSQLLGAVFIIVMGDMKGGWANQPAGTLKTALIFEAVLACAALPLPLMLGWIRSQESDVVRGATKRFVRAFDRSRGSRGENDVGEGPSGS